MAMQIDEWCRPVFEEDDLLEMFYSGEHFDVLVVNTPEIKKFNDHCIEFDQLDHTFDVWTAPNQSPEDFHKERQNNWFVPDEYKNFPIDEFILQQCQTDEEINRINFELKLFRENDMMNVLIFLKWFVDTMRSKNLFWGVGRGSSVASYALYLLGVHKINSIKYQLDIWEFIKEIT